MDDVPNLKIDGVANEGKTEKLDKLNIMVIILNYFN